MGILAPFVIYREENVRPRGKLGRTVMSIFHKLASVKGFARNAARISILAIYSGAIVVLSAYSAKADFITRSDFDSSAVVSDLNNLGPAPDAFATPFTLGI
jgi:hypothetical protein